MSSIRVNYLYEEYPGDWSEMYNRGALKALAPFEVVPVNVTGFRPWEVSKAVKDAPECDVWYSFSIGDLTLEPLMNAHMHSSVEKKPIILHNHGGMETSDFEALLLGDRDTTVLPKLMREERVHVLFNSEHNFRCFKAFYGKPKNSTVVGFPVNLPQISVSHRRGIVVSGRLSAGKQPYLAAAILAPFRDLVTFCTGNEGFGDMEAVLRRGGYKVIRVHGDEYYRILARNKIGLSATMTESFGLSVHEMVGMGMPVVLPDITVFKQFPDSWKYPAYDIKKARVIVARALDGQVDEPDLSVVYKDRFLAKVQDVVREMSKCTWR